MSIEDNIQDLIDSGKGDRGRLEHILAMVKTGRELYSSDKDYLDKLLAQTSQVADSSTTTDLQSEPSSSIPTSSPPSEIESLRQEIRHLQDRNHIIEEQLQSQGKLKRSRLRAFGNGVAGLALFLFGIGTILYQYYYLTNFEEINRYSYYTGDPMVYLIYQLVFQIGLVLFLGLCALYYGIRKIARN